MFSMLHYLYSLNEDLIRSPRNLDYDDEQIQLDNLESNQMDLNFENESIIIQPPEFLIIAMPGFGNAFINSNYPKLEKLTSIIDKNEKFKQKINLFQPDSNIIITLLNQKIPDEKCRQFVQFFINKIQPKKIIMFDQIYLEPTQFEELISKKENQEFIKIVETSEHKKIRKELNLASLPPPYFLQNFSASLITQAEILNIPSCVFVSLQERQTLSFEPFFAIDKILIPILFPQKNFSEIPEKKIREKYSKEISNFNSFHPTKDFYL
ncbi:proteasome assembly chaperone 1 [Anaeramoeba ignava]|uniref:Proteasome assembly chaperone 1 n=1 Tax=Anaeramoeba ignava TaxID=1746090 RepID=A0A9Q0RCH5_ANAIG|nr:proteasome assembly chaperone 1 [Anaeramoeba ignava]